MFGKHYTTETEWGAAAGWRGAAQPPAPKRGKKKVKKGKIKNTNRTLKTAFNLRQMLPKAKFPSKGWMETKNGSAGEP